MIRAMIILALSMMAAPSAWAHSRFNPAGNIPGRTITILKTGPCGGIARTTTPKVLQAGSTVNVDWEETINHPGYYEFYFSPANDANFTLIKTVPDDQNGTNDLPHEFHNTVTLPNTPCDACTLQMIQVMTENPAAPTYYYSCADIQLTTQTPPPPAPSPTPAPAPVPLPSPTPGTCH
jgi:hypothetical protein